MGDPVGLLPHVPGCIGVALGELFYWDIAVEIFFEREVDVPGEISPGIDTARLFQPPQIITKFQAGVCDGNWGMGGMLLWMRSTATQKSPTGQPRTIRVRMYCSEADGLL